MRTQRDGNQSASQLLHSQAHTTLARARRRVERQCRQRAAEREGRRAPVNGDQVPRPTTHRHPCTKSTDNSNTSRSVLEPSDAEAPSFADVPGATWRRNTVSRPVHAAENTTAQDPPVYTAQAPKPTLHNKNIRLQAESAGIHVLGRGRATQPPPKSPPGNHHHTSTPRGNTPKEPTVPTPQGPTPRSRPLHHIRRASSAVICARGRGRETQPTPWSPPRSPQPHPRTQMCPTPRHDRAHAPGPRAAHAPPIPPTAC